MTELADFWSQFRAHVCDIEVHGCPRLPRQLKLDDALWLCKLDNAIRRMKTRRCLPAVQSLQDKRALVVGGNYRVVEHDLVATVQSLGRSICETVKLWDARHTKGALR